jgi:hypothetical protein
VEEHVRTYARLRLERAREDLETARDNIKQEHYRTAVNRAYYAVFHIRHYISPDSTLSKLVTPYYATYQHPV